MLTRLGLTRSPSRQSVPAEIYISIVDSLYSDSRSLFMGSIAVSMAVLLTAWKADEPLIYYCALAVALVAVIRAFGVRAYMRHRPDLKTFEDAAKWEFRYGVGTAAYVALLGVWCVIAFAATSDPFVQFASATATIANLIGVAGRNFGSSRLIAVQILCAAPLMTVAMLLSRDVHYAVYALFFMVFFVAMKFISDRLRSTLMDAVIAARDNKLLASRFDAALNNMSLGLCMFDANRRLIVFNRRCSELLGVSPIFARHGLSAGELLRDAARAGTIDEPSADRLTAEINTRLSSGLGEDMEILTSGGRTLEMTFQPMENGGSVVLIEDITDRKAAAAKIQHLARYDSLTGLPNRTFFRDQMELTLARMQRSKDACGILFVDLDEFKQINDTMGHPFGDALLRAVAERLRGIARESDIVARFGGDEFVILQYPIRQPDEAASLARRIVDALGETFEIESHQLVIGASIGIAIGPQDGANPDLLLKNADMALYRTKSEGRGAWRFFEHEMDVKAQARRNLEIDLRNAVASGSFRLYYQPLIDLKTRKISTCEALLRWPHPERGMVSPAEFVPIAEEMGLIVEIGRHVLDQACLECMQWPSNIRVAVNLSPIQFRRGNLVESVRSALAKSGLRADRLELEITESVLVQDTEATRACLLQLREMGVRISLDDFGTGYSSLSYLHSFPLDKVKIDRSFVQGIAGSERSLTLLRGVARLSAELGLAVVVEGVETDDELALITREARVNEAQGFLFSPAIPGPAMRDMLAASTARPAKVKVA